MKVLLTLPRYSGHVFGRHTHGHRSTQSIARLRSGEHLESRITWSEVLESDLDWEYPIAPWQSRIDIRKHA